jgi:hypothetical protein
VGRQEQDLSELLDKRARDKEQGQTRAVARPSPTGTRPPDHFQTRHRPLHQVLGTPTGHHGRAVVPTESPFELRQRATEATDSPTDPRAAKRRRCDATPPTKLGYAQSLFGATLSLSAVPISSAPPRRSIGSTYRGQPGMSSPQEESMPDAEPVGEDRAVFGSVSLQANSSGRRAVVAPSRTTVEASGRAKLGNEKISKPAAGPVAREFFKAAVPMPRAGRPPAMDTGDDHLRSSGSIQPRAGAIGHAMVSRVIEKETGMRATDAIEPTPERVQQDACMTDNLDLGTSLSQAIVLDDGSNQRPSGTANKTAKSARTALTVVGQRPPRLHDSSSGRPKSMEIPEAMEDRSNEERTELRLKPRQKRGLLLLSEKRTKTSHPNRRIPRAENESPPPVPLWEPTDAAAPEVDLSSGAKPANNEAAVLEDDPFAPSPSPPGELRSELNSLAAMPDRPGDLEDQTGGEKVSLMPTDAAADRSEYESTAAVGSRLLGPIIDDSGNKAGSILHPAASPRGRRLRPRGKDSAQPDQKSGEPTSPNRRRGVRSLAQEASRAEPARQAPKTKRPEDKVSKPSRRKVSEADPGDSGNEEQPVARVGPRLARLSRKGLKSREVIGFVPSSPPVSNLANPIKTPPSASGSRTAVDTAAAICVSERGCKDLSVPDKPKPPVENFQRSLAPTASTRDALPVVQRHNSLHQDKAGDRMADEPNEETRLFSVQPSDDPLDPSKRHDLVPCESSLLPVGKDTNKETVLSISAAESKSIAALEKERAPTMNRPTSGTPESAVAMGITASLSQLDSSPTLPVSGKREVEGDSCVTKGAGKLLPEALPPEPARPRIVNPATRGRKAALKSDAAGQVPQSILPTEAVPAPTRMRPTAMPQPEAVAHERPKRKMTFPGFTSARGGGPWSREAHDLLESVHPG